MSRKKHCTDKSQKITHFEISGWDSAIRCMYMSKNTYNEELEEKLVAAENFIGAIKYLGDCELDEEGFALLDWYQEQVEKVIKWGAVHYNLLKHVDFTCTVVGLHRGAQDDFDSHAERFDTRIIRMSTREKNNLDLIEISDFYKGKILTFSDLNKKLSLPEAITYDDAIYIKTSLGYVREDCVDDKDARRGLIPLAVSSSFTFKCDIAEFCHVFRERNEDGNANPELKQLVEMIAEEIENRYPLLTRDFLLTKCIQ